MTGNQISLFSIQKTFEHIDLVPTVMSAPNTLYPDIPFPFADQSDTGEDDLDDVVYSE